MPSADLAALTKEIKDGFAALVAAVTASQAAVDLAPLVAQVQRVAEGIEASNEQVTALTQADNTGQMRVQVNPDMPI